ncbi:trans-sulfuration enzyme family protein [Amorphus orientalis]|uniref:Cystathionine gamma-synthase n=1 Tax=Amorphus orientalis TaxID=649198 RepID=A0AAE4ATK5_9HYPH|nr:PLP-dependent aspartate aminotransferase family protein [Amorphus orientalis]MDQ0316242.1 cystathionine gamma-synthase [Amorphus orientalis]
MSKARDRGPLHPETIAAQALGRIDPATGGVVPPLQPATTFAREPDYSLVRPGHVYARDDGPTVREAEDIIAAMEHGVAARMFASGMAAIAALLRAGATGPIAVQKGIYYGTQIFATRTLAAHGVEIRWFDGSDLASLADALADEAVKLVFLETPSNPWLTVVDITEAANIAHRHGAKVAVDSTAATPILSTPLTLGADFVVHSATKSLNGHSDVLAGVIVAGNTDEAMWEAICRERHDAGAVLGAFEAWLLIRGMRTLGVRVKTASANAGAIAGYLAGHKGVEVVRYPGLIDHPGHAIARRQMPGGYGSLLSFDVVGGAEAALAVAGRLEHIVRATSLGGVESLIEHRKSVEDPMSGVPEGLLRLSVGIENVQDLLEDLEQALAPLA